MKTEKKFRSVTIPARIHKLLKELAEAENRTLSNMLSQIILEKWGKN